MQARLPDDSVLVTHLKTKTAREHTPSAAKAVSLAGQSKYLVQETRAFLESAPANVRTFFAQKLLGGMDNAALKSPSIMYSQDFQSAEGVSASVCPVR